MGSPTINSILDLATQWPQLRDVHPVFVLPGFLACDLSTVVLRAYLSHRGYRTLPWGLGKNRGPVDGLLARLVDRVRAEAEASQCAVTLIGHSLGGIYAREVAKSAPESVRMVMTLASPFRSTPDVGPCPAVVRLIERATKKPLKELLGAGVCGGIDSPPPVPSIAFYSKRDRVADWRSCMEVASPLAENVEVRTSHQRMVVSVSVMREIVRRLDDHTGRVTDVPCRSGLQLAAAAT